MAKAKSRPAFSKTADKLASIELSINQIVGRLAHVALKTDLERIVDRLTEHADKIDQIDPDNWPMKEQFNQMAAAVNKIAAYAAAMDETKQTMIKLTSKRIAKLEKKQQHLRVRLKRLEG